MTEKMQEKLQTQRKKRRRTTLFGMLGGLFLGLAAVTGLLTYWWFGGSLDRGRSPIQKTEVPGSVMEPPNKLNIIVMGVDSRPQEGDPGRSDTLLVMTVDTVSREVSTLSIPRDTRVRINGLGWDKINHAFSVGGAALTQQTTENFLGISIDYYVKVDMESFVRIVDAIGGVNIDVEKRMQYEDTWEHFVIDLNPGMQHMDGKTAIQYVRYRDEEGDIGRVARQQKFIRSVLAEITTPAILLKAPQIIREVLAALDTNIPAPLMLGLARKLKDGLSTGLKAGMVDGLPYYIDGISYWVPDVLKLRQNVAELQGVPFTGSIQLAAQRLAGEYQANLPANAHLDGGTYYVETDKAPTKAKSTPTTGTQTKVLPSGISPKTTAPDAATIHAQSVTPAQKERTVPKKQESHGT